MARTVQLSERAYATLKALKEPDESFSDTVMHLAASQKNALTLLNLGPLRDDFSLEEFRKQFDEELESRARGYITHRDSLTRTE